MFKMKLNTLFTVVIITFLLIQQSTAQCGRRKTSRIVNGVNTGVNEFTMMAGLVLLKGNPAVFCGATILSNYYSLTAAHCVVGKAANSMGELVGDHDYDAKNDTPYAKLYLVTGYLVYPGYSSNPNYNDIAIIQTQYITYNVAVGPVCLPPTNLVFTGSTVEVVGWGTLAFGGPVSTVLKKTSLGVISNAQCNNYYVNIQGSQMCTYASGRDSCQYDSGGPVFVMINGAVNLAGVINAGNGCATNYPSINTRVTSFIGWIKQNTGI